MRCTTACAWEAKFWLGQASSSMHFPHKLWLCRGHGYPNPPPRAEWLNLCLLGSIQEACLISCLYMVSTHPLPEELAVLLKRALPPGTQHRPLVGVPLHTCFYTASFPRRSACSLCTTPMCYIGGFDSCAASSCHWQEGGINRARSAYPGYTTSL